MSCVSRTPPSGTVDIALIDARNEALAAAKTVTEAFSSALLQSDVDAIAISNKAAADKLNALLQRLKLATGFDSAGTDGPAAADVSGAVVTAQSQLDRITPSISADMARLSSLSPVTLASLGNKDTQPSRSTLEIMCMVTHKLLLSTNDHSLGYYLTF